MADNHYRYGHSSGQQPPLPFAQSTPIPNSTGHYGSHQQPNAHTGNYAALNNSYQYNANNIPGLGMGASLPPVSYQIESNPGWYSQPPVVQHQNSMQAQGVAPTTSREEEPRKNVPERGAGTTSHQEQGENTLEEGELSEGEFEDLYEPKDSTGIAVPVTQPRSGSEHRGESIGDADGSSIYDGATPRGEVTTNSTSVSLPAAEREYSPGGDWEPNSQEREKSGSYSPYLSPREIQRRVSVSKPSAHEAKQIPHAKPAVQSLPGIGLAPTHQLPAVDSFANATHHARAVTDSNNASAERPASDKSSAPHTFRSVTEAKKKAQEAILGLWPLKVRYQDYIEEGVDEKTITALFTELGLEASLPKPATMNKTTNDSQIPASSGSDLSKASPKSSNANDQLPAKQPTTAEAAASTGNMGGPKAVVKSAAEERKDKIARKLAAKAQKPVVATQPSVPTPPSQSTQARTAQTQPTQTNLSMAAPATASPAKTKTRAENNAILHQKLAALKKAQERAIADKKPTAESGTKPAASLAMSSNPVAISDSRGAIEPATSSPAITIPPAEATRRSVSAENSITKEGGIPGLSLSTQPVQLATRNLKRPVASDFDSYSTPNGTLKRIRTEDTLIINVSDDEDVEMDMGSPTDEPNSANEITNPPQRLLGAFPPLSNSPNWKQRSSPSSSAMPPASNKDTKLDLLTKRIEEARRKIAEAEAKKSAAKPNMTQSPQAEMPTMESPSQPNDLQVLKARGEARKVNAQRRARIVSYELPSVDATLKAKQEMLKEAVARAAQLELEIQASIEERDKLATEAEELEKSPEPASDATSTHAESSAGLSSHQVDRPPTPSNSESGSDISADVSMDEGDDTTSSDQRAASSEVGSNRLSAEPKFPASEERVAATAAADLSQLDHTPTDGELPAEAGNGNALPEDILSVENSERSPSATAVAPAGQPMKQEQPKVNGSEPSPQQDSSNDEMYSSEAVSAPTASITPLLRRDNLVVPLMDRSGSISLIDEPPASQGLTGTVPPQAVQVPTSSTLADPSRLAQVSSSHEHPLLTEMQGGSEQEPRLDDVLSYHSPLSYFRAYRFHPNYFDEVARGLKSMTYSSRIDPMRPLCSFELSGEQCPNGSACEFQHFDSMVLPDAEIITQLGSADMFTGDTRNRFIEGLKRVLNDLKANKVRDFDRITKAIVKYRQEFVEDKSKVLPLDAGTS
ncbi:hypothetical protein GGR52DRAFT_544680 [Hypoxylon sp. FL1284]|nr:hypothetical protein GGR52DRAFT_544680 [Hypoxylon sp. FL1284]